MNAVRRANDLGFKPMDWCATGTLKDQGRLGWIEVGLFLRPNWRISLKDRTGPLSWKQTSTAINQCND